MNALRQLLIDEGRLVPREQQVAGPACPVALQLDGRGRYKAAVTIWTKHRKLAARLLDGQRAAPWLLRLLRRFAGA